MASVIRTFTPAPTPLNTDELAEVRCSLRSGIEPTLKQSLRLLATIEALQKALVLQAGRMADMCEPASAVCSRNDCGEPGGFHAPLELTAGHISIAFRLPLCSEHADELPWLVRLREIRGWDCGLLLESAAGGRVR